MREKLLRPALELLCRDESCGYRAAAVVTLGRTGSARDLPGLVEFLKDPCAEVRGAACLSMALLGSGDALPPLLDILANCEEEMGVRTFAAAALGLTGSLDAVPGLVGVLLDREQPAAVRGAAGMALGFLPDRAANRMLAGILSDSRDDARVRSLSAGALGRQAMLDGAKPLAAALRDRPVDVRRSAALALGAIRFRSKAQETFSHALARYASWREQGSLSPEARRRLEELIEELRARVKAEDKRVARVRRGVVRVLSRAVDKDPDAQARAFALLSLGEIGGPEATKVIDSILRRKVHPLKPWAGLAAGIAHDAALAPRLMQAFDRPGEKSSIRAAMAIGLALLKDRTASTRLAEVARDGSEDPALRGYAVLALAMTGDMRAEKIATESLRDGSPSALSRSAAIALGLVGSDPAGARLRRLLEMETDPQVRSAAAIGLGYLRTPLAFQALARRVTEKGGSFRARLYSILAAGYVGGRSGGPPLQARFAWFLNYRVRLPALDRLITLL